MSKTENKDKTKDSAPKVKSAILEELLEEMYIKYIEYYSNLLDGDDFIPSTDMSQIRTFLKDNNITVDTFRNKDLKIKAEEAQANMAKMVNNVEFNNRIKADIDNDIKELMEG